MDKYAIHFFPFQLYISDYNFKPPNLNDSVFVLYPLLAILDK